MRASIFDNFGCDFSIAHHLKLQNAHVVFSVVPDDGDEVVRLDSVSLGQLVELRQDGNAVIVKNSGHIPTGWHRTRGMSRSGGGESCFGDFRSSRWF